MPEKRELPPMSASYYRTIPIDVYLRQGHEPCRSIHATVHSGIRVRTLLGHIGAQVKSLDAAGFEVADRGELSVQVSSVTVSRRPWIKEDGEEIPYRHCPDPNVQIVTVVPPSVTPSDLVASYNALAAACGDSIDIGIRLDAAMRELAEIPYEVAGEVVDVWTTISTGGVPGWTTKQFGKPGTVEFDYLVYVDAT